MTLNLSYKQLQEELEKANRKIEILEKVISTIQKILTEHIGISKDIPMIIINKEKGSGALSVGGLYGALWLEVF